MSHILTANAHGQQQQQQLLFDTASDQGRPEFSRKSLSESEMCRRVFHIQEPTTRQEGLDFTSSKPTSPPPKQLAPVSPGPAVALATSELDSTLKSALPCIPPHADYTIIKGTYEAAYHVALPENQSPRYGNKKKALDTTVEHLNNTSKPSPLLPGSKVLAVAEWTFPKDDKGREVMNKWDFINSEIAKGHDVDFVPTKIGTLYKNPRPQRRGRKRKNRVSIVDGRGVPILNSLVRDVVFDTRYLKYDDSPYGFLDQLVQPPVVIADPSCENSDALAEKYLQSIADPPINLTKTSRVGAYFQARVCRHKDDYHDKRDGSYLPT
jgi:hypothetical protein